MMIPRTLRSDMNTIMGQSLTGKMLSPYGSIEYMHAEINARIPDIIIKHLKQKTCLLIKMAVDTDKKKLANLKNVSKCKNLDVAIKTQNAPYCCSCLGNDEERY